MTSKKAVLTRRAFETHLHKHNISAQHYHVKNSRFADNTFTKAVAEAQQTISYCGVNVHFQNGIAEKQICNLQEGARIQLHHAKLRWPSVIDLYLWPYVLRCKVHLDNTMPNKADRTCLLKWLTGSTVSPKLKHNLTFGCPIYALNASLQAGNFIPKWNPRARLGVNLGPSPRHAASATVFHIFN
eukprot:6673658-Ditylum_brightwellii.AAC.1